MYYEEATINGVRCYRSSPDAEWIPLDARTLTTRVRQAEEAMTELAAAASPPGAADARLPDLDPESYRQGWEAAKADAAPTPDLLNAWDALRPFARVAEWADDDALPLPPDSRVVSEFGEHTLTVGDFRAARAALAALPGAAPEPQPPATNVSALVDAATEVAEWWANWMPDDARAQGGGDALATLRAELARYATLPAFETREPAGAPAPAQDGALPRDLRPVFALIHAQTSLGLQKWYEVVYHDGERWCAFAGSDSFTKEDGGQVIAWRYADSILPALYPTARLGAPAPAPAGGEGAA